MNSFCKLNMRLKILLATIAVIFLISLSPALAAEVWDLTGMYTIVFTCTSGCSGDYPHTMTIDVMDLGTGDFSGTGNYIPNTAFTWDVAGTVSGSSVEFSILYTGSNAGYYVDLIGTIASDGSMSGEATSSLGQEFIWQTTTGAATMKRTAEITSPEEGEEVSGLVSFDATLYDDDTNDNVQWAVRKGTCAAGTNTVFGNVDGFHDSYTWTNNVFNAVADTSTWIPGGYCFVFNPTEGAGEENIRLTREFVVVENVELWAVKYDWGYPAPGYSFAKWPIFESWMNVKIENRGQGDAFDVSATISGWPANVEIVDGGVTLGDISAGSSAWSSDDIFRLKVDMANPVDPCEGIFWDITYNDASGNMHTIENVPEFPPGEEPAYCRE